MDLNNARTLLFPSNHVPCGFSRCHGWWYAGTSATQCTYLVVSLQSCAMGATCGFSRCHGWWCARVSTIQHKCIVVSLQPCVMGAAVVSVGAIGDGVLGPQPHNAHILLFPPTTYYRCLWFQ